MSTSRENRVFALKKNFFGLIAHLVNLHEQDQAFDSFFLWSNYDFQFIPNNETNFLLIHSESKNKKKLWIFSQCVDNAPHWNLPRIWSVTYELQNHIETNQTLWRKSLETQIQNSFMKKDLQFFAGL